MQDEWQRKYNAKQHAKRVQNAKSTLAKSWKSGKSSTSSKSGSTKSRKRDRTSVGQPSSIFDSQSNLSDYTTQERRDIHKIPLYSILRSKGLQQYTKTLVARGYGYCTEGMALIEEDLFEELLDEINVIPGHRNKFKKMRTEILHDLKFRDKQRKMKRYEREGEEFQQKQLRNQASGKIKGRTTEDLETEEPDSWGSNTGNKKLRQSNIKEIGFDYFMDSADLSREQQELIEEMFYGIEEAQEKSYKLGGKRGRNNKTAPTGNNSASKLGGEFIEGGRGRESRDKILVSNDNYISHGGEDETSEDSSLGLEVPEKINRRLRNRPMSAKGGAKPFRRPEKAVNNFGKKSGASRVELRGRSKKRTTVPRGPPSNAANRRKTRDTQKRAVDAPLSTTKNTQKKISKNGKNKPESILKSNPKYKSNTTKTLKTRGGLKQTKNPRKKNNNNTNEEDFNDDSYEVNDELFKFNDSYAEDEDEDYDDDEDEIEDLVNDQGGYKKNKNQKRREGNPQNEGKQDHKEYIDYGGDDADQELDEQFEWDEIEDEVDGEGIDEDINNHPYKNTGYPSYKKVKSQGVRGFGNSSPNKLEDEEKEIQWDQFEGEENEETNHFSSIPESNNESPSKTFTNSKDKDSSKKSSPQTQKLQIKNTHTPNIKAINSGKQKTRTIMTSTSDLKPFQLIKKQKKDKRAQKNPPMLDVTDESIEPVIPKNQQLKQSDLTKPYEANPRIMKTLHQKNIIPKQETNFGIEKIDLNYKKVKNETYKSIEGVKLTSTILNIDLDEMVYCLSHVIRIHIKRGYEQEKIIDVQGQVIDPNNIDYESSMAFLEKQTEMKMDEISKPSSNQETGGGDLDDQCNFEGDEDPGEENVLLSMGDIPQQKVGVQPNLEESEELDEDFLGGLPPLSRPSSKNSKSNATAPSMTSFRRSLDPISEKSGEDELSLQQVVSDDETVDEDLTRLSISMETRYEYLFEEEIDVKELKAKQIFDRVFLDVEARFYVPTIQEVNNYCLNILQTAKMEKEIAIVCLVYLEKVMIGASSLITPRNWRRLVLTSLIVASKVWDDESFENHNFAKVFNLYTTEDVNEMERMFLERIDYDLEITTAEYTKYYFIIRQYVRDDQKGKTLRPLPIKTVLDLQNGKSNGGVLRLADFKAAANKSFQIQGLSTTKIIKTVFL